MIFPVQGRSGPEKEVRFYFSVTMTSTESFSRKVSQERLGSFRFQARTASTL